MAKKKHGNHNRKATPSVAQVQAEKPVRIRLIDWRSAFLTILLAVACLAAIVVLEVFQVFDNIIGSILFMVIAFFGCALLFDLGFIFTARVTVFEGSVNAGKDKSGNLMMFHAASVKHIDIRDQKTDEVIPEDKKSYRKVTLTFHMESGRVNQREVNYITQARLDAIRREVMGR